MSHALGLICDTMAKQKASQVSEEIKMFLTNQSFHSTKKGMQIMSSI